MEKFKILGGGGNGISVSKQFWEVPKSLGGWGAALQVLCIRTNMLHVSLLLCICS